MSCSTWVGHRLGQQQQQELARTIELRRRIAERREALELGTVAPAAAPVRAQGWRGLLVRAHVVHRLTH